ncbi:MAG: energy transducer TonB [Opitutales bacterium]|nr:energy transducer TonB [Opitutales bacterium]
MALNNGREGFHKPAGRPLVIRMVLATVIMTLAIIFILPFTQLLQTDPRDMHRVRSIDIAPPPPPPPPPDPPPPEEEQQDPDVDDLSTPPPPISLSQLEAALNPGIGGALGQAVDLGAFGVAPDAAAEMQIFQLGDLDRRPQRLRTVTPRFPPEFSVRAYQGTVRARIMIDEEGNVTVMEIVESTHREAVQPVRQALAQWQFEPPVRDGRPVRATYIQPIPYDFAN